MRTIECIEAIICQYENVKPESLKTKSRKRKVCDIRQMVMYFAIHSGKTLAFTGAYYSRDHVTAFSAKKVIQDRYDTEPEFRRKIDFYDLLLKESDKYDIPDTYKSKLTWLRYEVEKLANELQKIAI